MRQQAMNFIFGKHNVRRQHGGIRKQLEITTHFGQQPQTRAYEPISISPQTLTRLTTKYINRINEIFKAIFVY